MLFHPQLTFKEKVVKYLLIWVCLIVTVYLGFYIQNHFFSTKESEKVVTKYKEVGVVKLGDLKLGESVLWNGFPMCVSSIDTQNIKSTRNDNPEETEPPVVINLRHEGQCK